MKKNIQRVLITVLVFSFILVPTSKVEAASYPYTDYLFGTWVSDTYVGHTVAVLNSYERSGMVKSVKVKNSKIASAKIDGKYIVITGKKVGETTATAIYKDGRKVTEKIKVYPNYISKSVRVRGKKISIGESLAQVKKDFGTKFKVIKEKGMKGKYLAYTDDMSKLLIVGICKDKVVDIYTTSSDWKSGNIGFGVKDPGEKYKGLKGKISYTQEVFTDYFRMSSFIDKYLLSHPLQFLQHRVLSCSTSLDKKPRIYYAFEASSTHGTYEMGDDSYATFKIYNLLERGAKVAAKSKGFTIQFKTEYDRFS